MEPIKLLVSRKFNCKYTKATFSIVTSISDLVVYILVEVSFYIRICLLSVMYVFQCGKYGCLGVEVMVAMANKSENSISYQGSQKGIDFLSKRPDILSDFFLFSTSMSLYSFCLHFLLHLEMKYEKSSLIIGI